MAKTKGELLVKAKELKLDVSEKNTVAEIAEAIKQARESAKEVADQAERVVNEVSEAIDKQAEQVSLAQSDDSKSESESESNKATEGAVHYAKAGKRSEKSVKEAEAEAERQARKEAGDTTPQGDNEANIQRGPAPKTRPLAERKSKAYKKVAQKVDKAKLYSLAEAIKLATETAVTKFDSTVEMHVRLGVDPKQADQNIRATVTLPNGTGKSVRVAAMVGEDEVKAVKQAGADIAGESAVIDLLSKEKLDFDVLVATPQLMPKLGHFARLLGPRGLMPNPKAGTVSANAVQAVKEAKAGKIEYRVDKQGIVHLGIGKVSFGADKLRQNAQTLIDSLKSARPSTLKGSYMLSVTISTTMGPGIKVEL